MPPLKRLPDRSWVRPAYRREAYVVPAKELAYLRSCPVIDEMNVYDGAYQNYDELARFDDAGRSYVRLVERSQGWIIEAELSNDVPATIRTAPPEDAWVHARIQDARSTSYVPIEGDPPDGVVDPNARQGP